MRNRTFLLAALGVIAGVNASPAAPQGGFPHAKHAKLFPVCEGCHDVLTGARQVLYPTAPDCVRCHDGTRAKTVEWSEAPRRASNLKFSHASHAAVIDSAYRNGSSVICQSCHALSADAIRMHVGPPQPTLCLSCHTNEPPGHQAPSARCATCHVPLTTARAMSVAQISRISRPAWHDDSSFASRHGRDWPDRRASETCAVCHSRDTCERCHANGNRLPMVRALRHDARVAVLETGKLPRYPTPLSHLGETWRARHGRDPGANDRNPTCANCHTRAACTPCHVDGGGKPGAVIAALPGAQQGRGVIPRARPEPR